MTQLCDMTATTLQTMVQRRECSATEIAESCSNRIEAMEPKVKGFVQFDRSATMKQAKVLDSSEVKGPMHGIPVAIKDTIDVAGLIFSWGSAGHSHRIPSLHALV